MQDLAYLKHANTARRFKAPAFAKRHYEALALVMQAECPGANWDPNKRAQWIVIRNGLADMLARDNAGFVAERFKAACEPGANVKARNSNPPAPAW